MSTIDENTVKLDDGTTITLLEYVDRLKADGLEYLTDEDMANGHGGTAIKWGTGSLHEVRVSDGKGILQPGLYAVPDNAECVIDRDGFILIALKDGQETA